MEFSRISLVVLNVKFVTSKKEINKLSITEAFLLKWQNHWLLSLVRHRLEFVNETYDKLNSMICLIADAITKKNEEKTWQINVIPGGTMSTMWICEWVRLSTFEESQYAAMWVRTRAWISLVNVGHSTHIAAYCDSSELVEPIRRLLIETWWFQNYRLPLLLQHRSQRWTGRVFICSSVSSDRGDISLGRPMI